MTNHEDGHQPLKIYADRSHYRAEHRGLLASILRPYWKDFPFTDEERARDYGQQVRQYLIVDSPDEADIGVLPMHWVHYYQTGTLAQAVAFINSVKAKGKPVVTENSGDYSVPLPVDDVYLFQANCYKSRRHPHEYALPVFIRDLLQELGEEAISIHPRHETPLIGFCGQAYDPMWRKAVKPLSIAYRNLKFHLKLTHFEPHALYPPTFLRSRVLSILEQSDKVRTNFVKRMYYRGGNEKSKEQLRQEFLNNIQDTDYTICIRGTGNFSQRLYEVLALGRIPIFIDTDSILPFDDVIDWRSHCIWVKPAELELLPEKVSEFHNALDASEFADLQRRCRELWEDRLSFSGFFTHFGEHLEFGENRASVSRKNESEVPLDCITT
jgi:hypothetical protein